MRWLWLFLLMALCFSWNTAKSQGFHDVQPKSLKNWAIPACQGAKEAGIRSHHFDLSATATTLTLQKDPPKIDKAAVVCKTPSKLIAPNMQRLMRYMDRIKDQCKFSIENDCTRVMFKFADENGDRRLTAPEIKKSLLTGLMLAELVDNGTLNAAAKVKIQARAKAEGDKTATALIQQYDTDHSKTLDYNELSVGLTNPPHGLIIKEILEKTAHYFPVFGIAAATIQP